MSVTETVVPDGEAYVVDHPNGAGGTPASETFEGRGMGWIRDLPDVRDYSAASPQIAPLLAKTAISAAAALPSKVDLRPGCSPIEDQGSLGSCTAHAAMGIAEYCQKRSTGKFIDGSRLFVYKVTRKMNGWTGDTGAFLRSTMGEMVMFGVPPEQYYGYDIAKFDKDPPAFAYAAAQGFQATSYFRLDPPSPAVAPADLLVAIKTQLAANWPCMFGFTVYSSISAANKTGRIPYPSPTDRVQGGHAVAAVGYHDNVTVKHPNGSSTKGALLIRNSWGTGWGEDGYGWLPYKYVLSQLAVDWWVLVKTEWIDMGIFE